MRSQPNASLWVQKIDGEPETPIRLQVRANDVSITLEQPKATFHLNFPAKVAFNGVVRVAVFANGQNFGVA